MNDEQYLITLHDEAAWEAQQWRIVQGLFEEIVADEVIRTAREDERLDAEAAMESVRSRLLAEEAAARGRMMRLREQIGRRPRRRQPRAASI